MTAPKRNQKKPAAKPAPLPVNEGLAGRLDDIEQYRSLIGQAKKVSEKATLIEALPAVLDAMRAMLIESARELEAAEQRRDDVLAANHNLADAVDRANDEKRVFRERITVLEAEAGELRAAGDAAARDIAALRLERSSMERRMETLKQAHSSAMALAESHQKDAVDARGDLADAVRALRAISRLPWWKSARAYAKASLSVFA